MTPAMRVRRKVKVTRVLRFEATPARFRGTCVGRNVGPSAETLEDLPG
jgi:hypothetical protein